jgi:predicted GIY-YIG superfamily endonuclease
MKTNIVYLLHFDRPISDNHTTQHYIGSAVDLGPRLNAHRFGRGARLTQVALERNNPFVVAQTWEAPGEARQLERQLKARKNAPLLCPICQAEAKARKAEQAKQRKAKFGK